MSTDTSATAASGTNSTAGSTAAGNTAGTAPGRTTAADSTAGRAGRGGRPVALVTGGGTGIGAATAGRLAADGHDIVIGGRRADRLERCAAAIRAEHGEAAVTTLVLDVTDEQSVQDAVAQLPRLDVLVNNAGGAHGSDPVERADLGDWRTMYETNVLGTVRMTNAALPLLRRSAGATIVVISSTAADVVYEGGAGYCAAKHAESVVAQGLRLELNGEPIRVVDIRPGMVHTEEFALTRLGDQGRADQVYAGVDRPLVADDVAACVAFAVGLPQHVNIDTIVVKPVAQAAAHKVFRAPIAWDPSAAEPDDQPDSHDEPDPHGEPESHDEPDPHGEPEPADGEDLR